MGEQVDLGEGEEGRGLPLNCVDLSETNGEQILCVQTSSFVPDNIWIGFTVISHISLLPFLYLLTILRKIFIL